jgi:phage gp29-like protein
MGSLCTTGQAVTPAAGRCAGLTRREPTIHQRRAGGVMGPPRVRKPEAYEMVAARHGQNLTPRRIAQILNDADQGYVAAWHDLLNECRQKDGDLQSMLSTREESLLARGWSISPVVEPGQREAGSRSRRNADFCRSALEGVRDLNASLSHLLDARYKAFSACETEWTKSRKGDVVPFKLHPIQGRRWFVTADNRVELYDDGRENPPLDLVGKHPWRFVVHKPRTNGDVLAREGLGRCLVWFSAFTTWSLRDWLLFAELFGKPWRIASYEGNTYSEELDVVIREILDSMTASTYAILPEGVKLDVAWPQSPGGQTASPSAGILSYCRAVKALVILGQQATTGDTQGGLGGKGDARHEVRKDLEAADDKGISETIRWQVLGPLVWLKYGPNEIPPKFSFNVAEAIDVKAWLEAAKIACKELGVPLSKAQVYDVTGLHAPLNEEDTLGGPAPTAPPPAPPASDGEAAGEADESAPEEGAEPQDDPEGDPAGGNETP